MLSKVRIDDLPAQTQNEGHRYVQFHTNLGSLLYANVLVRILWFRMNNKGYLYNSIISK